MATTGSGGRRSRPTHPPAEDHTTAHQDPLTEVQARDLLHDADIIRDPLHLDIRLSALERRIVETPEFQRLRGINQLALTWIAYPGALHTRFLHSLGVLHVCRQMIETCNRNARLYSDLSDPGDPVPVTIPPYPELVARLCALMHDMAHVPFSHTLEKEGRVFTTDEWQDAARRDRIFAEESQFAGAFVGLLQPYGIQGSPALGVLHDVQAVLCADRNHVMDLPYPFVHDLVGNTICADLVDYVQRDMLFCGLTEGLAKRFLEYLAVLPVQHSMDLRRTEDAHHLAPFRSTRAEAVATTSDLLTRRTHRLVLLLYRYNERGEAVEKPPLVEEAIDLVRRRKAVAEKLYFHRTKIAASSMLIAAVDQSSYAAVDFWELSDLEVLKTLAGPKTLAGSPTPLHTQLLARKLLARKLFKPIYRATHHQSDESAASRTIDGAYNRFIDPAQRRALIKKLEWVIADRKCSGNIDDATGTVSVSCPKRGMNLKAFDMLVLSGPDALVQRLDNSSHPPTQLEIRAIKEGHEHLWRLEVFVDADLVDVSPADPFTRELAGAIQREIGPKNEIAEFTTVPNRDLDQWISDLKIERAIIEIGVQDQISHAEYQRLRSGLSLREGSDVLAEVRAWLQENHST